MKTFVTDTNVLLHDPACLNAFMNHELVIPLPVLDELDAAKARPDSVGRNARAVVRKLDELRKLGSLSEGVQYNDTIVRVELNHCDHAPKGLEIEKKDNRIISVALGLKKEDKQVVVISKDINLRVKCDVLGIDAEDYETDKMAEEPTLVYGGTKEVIVSSAVIDQLYDEECKGLPGFTGYPNQFLLLKSNEKENHVGLGRLVDGLLKPVKPPKHMSGIIPRNLEQRMAVDLLLDPKIKLVTLVGKAGCGKTLLAAAAALQSVLADCRTYHRMLIARPIQPMGKDLGYLPGDIEEKLDPWMQPLYDNLELIMGGDRHMLNMYKEQGIIQVEPLTYIRGRSIPKSFIILDEAQNLSPNEIKTIITRVGDNTKIVVTGDIEQIDNPYVDFADNGLTHVVERFKDHSIAGHITLRKGERSILAALAAKIL
jgi:PhoH-like ATPase